MLRHEDRLYHIVVSFPSICAKQFLICKFRRNEAICCLIGFGIGISCCLMYRWFRNTFFSLNYIKTPYNEYYDLNPYNKTNVNTTHLIDNTNKKNKLNTTNSRRKSPKNKRIDKNNDINNDLFTTNNSLYQNLAKYLNKHMCKSFKNRRSNNKKQFPLKKKFNLFQKSNSLSPIQSDSLQTTENSTLTSSTDSNNTFQPTDNLIRIDRINRSRHNSYTIMNESVNDLSFYDDDSLELLSQKSGCNLDVEYLGDIKFGIPMRNSINYVDKSLDEALLQINKLKDDMSHLCTDLDTLYHSKFKKLNIGNLSNASRNSSFSALEQDEELAEDYTTLNEHSRLKTPFRELNKKPIISLNEKYTQTELKSKRIKSKKKLRKKSKISKFNKKKLT
ncbi:unnamed protein product [Brachionus calyciflorus]|uniref:Uncharacterized protein n=1 Tax=Brachionus calyciflorus TaxID=104777 RepID=A0A813RR29_9BILA|nr:unnamed protein product [Brachionus calyciflorus]